MDSSLEIRKLSPSIVREFVTILEYADSWKRIMSIIPKTLRKDDYTCDVGVDNLPKYNSEHFRLIENASSKLRKSCTEILFNEWGTSGHVRPALGHLLHLLVKAELFRAADYVAVVLLKQTAPSRPKHGPAALVTFDLSENGDEDEIEKILDEINYPSSAIENINSYNVNINYSKESLKTHVIPQIVVSELPDTSEERPSFHVPMVVPKVKDTTSNSDNNAVDDEVSDMIKFSQSNICEDQDLPCLSAFEEPTVNSTSLPAFNLLLRDCHSDSSVSNLCESEIKEEKSEGNIPQLSELLNNTIHEVNKLEIESRKLDYNLNVPNLSILNATDSITTTTNSQVMPNISVLIASDTCISNNNDQPFIPNISGLIGTTKTSNLSIKTPNLTAQSDNSLLSQNIRSNNTSSRRTCVSPLPNLSLNTFLPHFTFNELENATNYFDMTPHKSSLEVDNSLFEGSGRFLGSGAFGSVFLALGLLERPIAIKKLHLSNVDVVNIDDTITKQFRNEVEVLCKYKHENLLSLVGYSCDGPTYCLMYEYISGGALKERLQHMKEKLLWTDRLYVALGTARAVSYLHTAFSNPLIHRDIKSANILLDCTNKPKLCDFGLIKLMPNQGTNTTTTAIGTSAYMAPEAFRGDVSVKIDTFSFGVVLLELLTALPPLDENRDGHDLVTYIGDCCDEDDISSLLDNKAGSWLCNNINVADILFSIACKCLEEKKKRPTMVEVTEFLIQLLQEVS